LFSGILRDLGLLKPNAFKVKFEESFEKYCRLLKVYTVGSELIIEIEIIFDA
jgi:hypothetical protein